MPTSVTGHQLRDSIHVAFRPSRPLRHSVFQLRVNILSTHPALSLSYSDIPIRIREIHELNSADAVEVLAKSYLCHRSCHSQNMMHDKRNC